MKLLRSLLGLFLCAQSLSAAAEGFDYYTLAVTLTPAFCDQNPKWRDSLQCRDRMAFSVHGLWPEKSQGRAPASCAGGPLQLPEKQEKSLRTIMPDPVLRKHEWTKHGRCSGLEAPAYFKLVEREFLQLKWPELMQPRGRDNIVERQVLLNEFHRLNPGFPERGVVLRCADKGRPPLLNEVRVCLNPQGKPAECAANYRPNCPTAIRIRSR